MTYVPIVPPTPAAPSPRARELADRLVNALLEYEETNPSVTKEDVRQAMQLAFQRTHAGAPMAAPVVAIALGALLFAGFAAFYFFGGAGPAPIATGATTIVVIGLLAVVAALVAVLRREP